MIPVYSLLLVRVLPLQVHTRPRVHWASGIPHALFRAEGFLQDSGAARREAANVCLMKPVFDEMNAPHSQSSSPAKDTDLILRSLRSKRLEGWMQRRDSRPSFETRAKARSSG